MPLPAVIGSDVPVAKSVIEALKGPVADSVYLAMLAMRFNNRIPKQQTRTLGRSINCLSMHKCYQ